MSFIANADQGLAETTLPKPQHCEVSGHFVQLRTLKGLPTPLESSGIFYQNCAKGLIWKTTIPVQESMVVTHNNEVLLGTGDDLVPAPSRNAKLIAELMQGLLSGRSENLSKNFHLQAVSGHKPSKQLFLLTPINGSFKRALQEIEVHFSTQENALTKVTIVVTDRNANLTRIEVLEAKQQALTTADDSCLEVAGISAQECQALTAHPSATETASD